MLVAGRRGTGACLELAHLGGAWDHALLGTKACGGVSLQELAQVLALASCLPNVADHPDLVGVSLLGVGQSQLLIGKVAVAELAELDDRAAPLREVLDVWWKAFRRRLGLGFLLAVATGDIILQNLVEGCRRWRREELVEVLGFDIESSLGSSSMLCSTMARLLWASRTRLRVSGPGLRP